VGGGVSGERAITPSALRYEAQRRTVNGYVHIATVRALMRRLADHMETMTPYERRDETPEPDAAMHAFIAGWFAHARNPKDAPLLVEEAWHAYRLIESSQ
jgi:hypothetical protein